MVLIFFPFNFLESDFKAFNTITNFDVISVDLYVDGIAFSSDVSSRSNTLANDEMSILGQC
jgi:hypothetical protein